jgi:hypothetical protein
LKDKADRFSDLLRNTDTSSNPEFTVLRKGILKDLRQVEKDVAGLRQAIDVVGKNRGKFPLITDTELTGRREFVSESSQSVGEIRSKIESQSVRDKMASDESRSKAAYGINNNNNTPENLQKENSRFIKNQVAEQQYMLKEQDNALDSLSGAIDRLDSLGREVNIELKEQNLMLNELDDELDDAGNKMNLVQQKLAKLLNTKNRCTIWTVVILFIIFIILLALVIYT